MKTKLISPEKNNGTDTYTAKDVLQHDYMGLCPDEVEGWKTRDPECQACAVLDLMLDTVNMESNMSGPEALFGRMPEIEDEVYIDFGDSFYARPELRGEVEDISDDGILINGEWIAWEEMVHIEVSEDWH